MNKKPPAPKKKAQPALKCERETLLTVEYHEMERFIKECTGHDAEIVAIEEWGNDSQHRFRVDGKLEMYEKKDWTKFKETGEASTFGLQAILNGLCSEGKLDKGTYLITVCW